MALIELLAKLQEAGLSEIESYALLARFLEEEAELFVKCTK